MLYQIISLLVVTLGTAYLGLVAYAWFFADNRIFPKTPASYSNLADQLILQASDGERITAVYRAGDASKPLVIYCHGNAEDLGDIQDRLDVFHAQGISVLAFDYPGYGTSTGTPSEAGCYAAAQAAYDYATPSASTCTK